MAIDSKVMEQQEILTPRAGHYQQRLTSLARSSSSEGLAKLLQAYMVTIN
jgi:hypothetical protein